MHTLQNLDRWRDEGHLTSAQHTMLTAMVRRERVSLFLELNALLYLGVLAFVAGLAATAAKYSDTWGDVAILVPATALLVAGLGYCIRHAQPYSRGEAPPRGLVYDYVLYLACLVFAVELGYVEYRFDVLQARWDAYLLLSAALYFLLAYRFDNRFVLSLAIATLGAWFGVRLSGWAPAMAISLRWGAIGYAGLLVLLATALYRLHVKRHFLDTYLHVAANAALAACTSAVLIGDTMSLWLVALLSGAGLVVVAGVRYRRFAYVAYGIIYGYVGVSRVLIRGVVGVMGVFGYIVVSAGAAVVLLVVLARRYGRDA